MNISSEECTCGLFHNKTLPSLSKETSHLTGDKQDNDDGEKIFSHRIRFVNVNQVCKGEQLNLNKIYQDTSLYIISESK